MPGDEPVFVVVRGKLDERGSQLFDGMRAIHSSGVSRLPLIATTAPPCRRPRRNRCLDRRIVQWVGQLGAITENVYVPTGFRGPGGLLLKGTS